MQENKTNPICLRVTDTDVQRMDALKVKMGVPAMAKGTLAYGLFTMGMREMEKQYGLAQGDHEPSAFDGTARRKIKAPRGRK